MKPLQEEKQKNKDPILKQRQDILDFLNVVLTSFKEEELQLKNNSSSNDTVQLNFEFMKNFQYQKAIAQLIGKVNLVCATSDLDKISIPSVLSLALVKKIKSLFHPKAYLLQLSLEKINNDLWVAEGLVKNYKYQVEQKFTNSSSREKEIEKELSKHLEYQNAILEQSMLSKKIKELNEAIEKLIEVNEGELKRKYALEEEVTGLTSIAKKLQTYLVYLKTKIKDDSVEKLLQDKIKKVKYLISVIQIGDIEFAPVWRLQDFQFCFDSYKATLEQHRTESSIREGIKMLPSFFSNFFTMSTGQHCVQEIEETLKKQSTLHKSSLHLV